MPRPTTLRSAAPILAAIALLAGAAAPSAAQAPIVTPTGDPSVDSDTIYALAVDSTAYPEDDVAFLLDDGVIRLEADGRHTRTYRQVAQILRQDAVEDWAEQSLGWSPGHEKLTVNWIRVVRPDGSVVSAEPRQVQDADVPATMGDPVYSDRKVRRASLSGVVPGTIVDISYTVEELKPFLPGDFYTTWSVTTAYPVMRSRLVVEVPASVTPLIREENLRFQRRTVERGGRRTYTWATKDVKTERAEMFAADSNGVYQSIALALPMTWDAISRWYAGLARERYAATPLLDSALAAVVAGARSRDDSVRAVHRWVAQDIRYVSISLGIGGYQPRMPDEVIESGYGDCKDKATLFVAALRRMGIEAHPVLLNSGGGVDRSLPTIDQLDHVIAAIPRGGAYTYVDLTAELTPYGTLPWGPQGEFGIVVHADGRGEVVTLTKDPMTANGSTTRIVGELREDGTFAGRVEEFATGIRQYGLRSLFAQPLDSTTRANMLRGIPAKMFGAGATGDSLIHTDGRDLITPPRMSFLVSGWRATSQAGDMHILTLPFGSMAGGANLATSLEASGPRRFPIDARGVIGWHVGISELVVTLPEGWTARLPANVRAESVFGSYVAEYSQQGREMRVVRRVAGGEGVFPPERVGDLTSWLREAAKDDARYIVLETGAR
ncbi:MAG TPA: DUF3857 and transglutaminase domain-containing protein [Gemmatimonadaceae bacterium]